MGAASGTGSFCVWHAAEQERGSQGRKQEQRLWQGAQGRAQKAEQQRSRENRAGGRKQNDRSVRGKALKWDSRWVQGLTYGMSAKKVGSY